MDWLVLSTSENAWHKGKITYCYYSWKTYKLPVNFGQKICHLSVYLVQLCIKLYVSYTLMKLETNKQTSQNFCLRCPRKWQSTPVLLPGKSHGWRSLVGYLQSMGSQRVRHDCATSLSAFTFQYIKSVEFFLLSVDYLEVCYLSFPNIWKFSS